MNLRKNGNHNFPETCKNCVIHPRILAGRFKHETSTDASHGCNPCLRLENLGNREVRQPKITDVGRDPMFGNLYSRPMNVEAFRLDRNKYRGRQLSQVIISHENKPTQRGTIVEFDGHFCADCEFLFRQSFQLNHQRRRITVTLLKPYLLLFAITWKRQPVHNNRLSIGSTPWLRETRKTQLTSTRYQMLSAPNSLLRKLLNGLTVC